MILDIGSGPHPKADATFFMDIHPWPRVTHLHDLHEIPYPFASETADKIYLGDVIEHITIFEVEPILKEILRILKPGGVLDLTTPDFKWICDRISKGDWFEQTTQGWLQKTPDGFTNAMGYFFGGWQDPNEYKMKGMGHVTGYDETHLIGLLEKCGYKTCRRVADERNPEPDRHSILRVLAER